MGEESQIPLIILVIVFYVVGLVIAFYIRIRKVYLIRQIKKTGRVISLSSTIISILTQQLQQQQQRQQVSPATGLPAPPPYTIETPQAPPPPRHSIQPNELPPPYMAPPPYTEAK